MNIFGIKTWVQMNIFISLYIGYSLYIFNRNSFSFMVPTIVEKDSLSNDAVGMIVSSIAMAYGIGKFLGGILVDTFTPRLMFAVGLFGVGIANLLFSYSVASWFPFLWFLNGLFQGPGWPACAKIIQRWYPSKGFGTLWSILSTAMNFAASIGPLLCAEYNSRNGGNWRYVMMICGSLTIGYSFATLFVVKDMPEEIGLTLKQLSDEHEDTATLNKKMSTTPDTMKINVSKEKSSSGQPKKSFQNIWLRIFLSHYTYMIGFGFCISNFVKGFVSNWGSLFLIQEKLTNERTAGLFLAWFELGGFAGTIFSGYVSDKLVNYFGIGRKGNPRHYIFIMFFICNALGFLALNSLSVIAGNRNYLLMLAFSIGFPIYGNLSLCGVLVMENAAKELSGTAHSCCALMGNVGLMLSGFPFSKLVSLIGWSNALYCCNVMLILTAIIFTISQGLNCRIGSLKIE